MVIKPPNIPLAAKIIAAHRSLESVALCRWREQWQRDKPVITVGTATCGRAAGARLVLDAFRDEIERRGLDYPLIEVGCFGHCYAEPLVTIYKPGQPPLSYGRANAVIARRLVQEYLLGDNPCPEYLLAAHETNALLPSFAEFPRGAYEKRIILQNCGLIDPAQIEHYIARGGYAALATVLQTTPAAVIQKIKDSGLRGRGGAGYPTGEKWQTCAAATGRPKYVICNADEGDPGAFMDRLLLESDPHAVIEGLLIAAYAVGARRGIFYVRAEYPLAIACLRTALAQAKQHHLTGRHILDSGFNFDIELFEGSGAFVCGEETALIASLEGKAAIPQFRPPYPAVRGLHDKPTLIDNVKTLACVRHILANRDGWFTRLGTPGSSGTALFALAGKVNNTGIAEVPMGTTLRQLIFDVGSGVPNGKKFKAVQIGGPSGGCLPESALDLPIDFNSLSGAGAMMGSGGLIVLDEDDCMVEIARYFLDFTQRESCGKCTFCRLGTRQMLEILDRITKGKGQPADLELLQDLAEDVQEGSLCGLGRTAPNPVLSTLRYFRAEYDAHIKEARCPALMCRDLITYNILPQKCERSCDACVGTCTVEAIYPNEKRIKVIDQAKCVKCGTCLPACPRQYGAIMKVSPVVSGEVR